LIEKNGQREKSTEAETIEIKNNQAWNEKPGESAWPGLPNRVIGHGGGAQIHGHNMLPYNDRAIGFSAPIQRAYSQVVEYDMVDLPYRRRLCLDLPPQPGYWPGPQRAPNVPWRSKQYGPAANAQSRLLGGYANHSPVRAQLAAHRRSAVFNRAGVFNTPAHHSPLIPTGQRLIAHPLVQIQQQHTVPPSIRTAQQPSSSYQP
ncbi:hypothetical protein MMC06_005057, partial [Schaereria dolodes]|nr:hypothetical protein [Schaereria dolodes]